MTFLYGDEEYDIVTDNIAECLSEILEKPISDTDYIVTEDNKVILLFDSSDNSDWDMSFMDED